MCILTHPFKTCSMKKTGQMNMVILLLRSSARTRFLNRTQFRHVPMPKTPSLFPHQVLMCILWVHTFLTNITAGWKFTLPGISAPPPPAPVRPNQTPLLFLSCLADQETLTQPQQELQPTTSRLRFATMAHIAMLLRIKELVLITAE